MGLPTITASRIYKGQLQKENGEEGYHSYDMFPDVGLVKVRIFSIIEDQQLNPKGIISDLQHGQASAGFGWNGNSTILWSQNQLLHCWSRLYSEFQRLQSRNQ
jgi:hypothetical protein